MKSVLLRKVRQVTSEPALRNWLVERFLGRHGAVPAFRDHCPPYLDGSLPLAKESPVSKFAELFSAAPKSPITLHLAGHTVILNPGEERELFKRSFGDIETLLSLHRFSWLPPIANEVDPAWVNALWTAWAGTCGMIDESWSWHPYTVSERAINICNYADHHGLPAPKAISAQMLADHGQAIAQNLEYFGEHNTSNHLANNGRGLFLIGLSLNMPNCADLGARILDEEAKRIFTSSGILREGSSHYHLLLARNYRLSLDVARKYAHPVASRLLEIVRSVYSPLPYLNLPGGMPLIGDISPDIPPSALSGEFEADIDAEPTDAHELIADGWLRADFGPWAGLWHVAPGGWSHMPGHGHQDCGSFELHYYDTPIFIDPGRGTYGESDAAALYRSGGVHNSLTIDGCDPYPPNKPYFSDDFRLRNGGPPPELKPIADGVSLTFSGYSRLNSVGLVSRLWSFDGEIMKISESVDGSRRRTITRTFCTELSVQNNGDSLILTENGMKFRLKIDRAEGRIEIERATRWIAYGKGRSATFIRVETKCALPWQGSLSLEKF